MKKLMKLFVISLLLIVLGGCASRTSGKVRVIDLVGDVKPSTVVNAENTVVTENLTIVFSNEDVAVRHYAVDGGWIFLITPTEITVINSDKSNESCKSMFENVVNPTSGLTNDQAVMPLIKAAEAEVQSQRAMQIIGMVGLCVIAFIIGASLVTGGDMFSSYGGNTFVYVSRGSSSFGGSSRSSGGSYTGHR